MKKSHLNNIIIFLIFLIFLVFILSIIGSVFNWEAVYIKTNSLNNVLETSTISVESLFSREGMRYIIGNSLSNFITFTPLVLFLFIMIGVGFAEKTGLFSSLFSVFGKKINKFFLTFVIVLISIVSTIISDIAFVFVIPLAAILFLVNKRNPLVGIIASFVAMASGYGFNLFISQMDYTLFSITESAARTIDSGYSVSIFGNLIFSIVTTVLLTILITYITEIFTVRRVNKYKKEDLSEDIIITRKEKRGLFLSFLAALMFIMFFIYMLIPFGTPLSGLLLDFDQSTVYGRIFSENSFVIQGLSFMLFIMLIVCGSLYKIGTRESKEKFTTYLYSSLNNIGGVLVLIFLSSQLIALFRKTNLGVVGTLWIGELLSKANFSAVPLLIVFFLLVSFINLFQTSSLLKWVYLAPYIVPTFIKSNLTPEFSQAVFRLADSSSNMMTPFFPFFVVFLGIMQIYNKGEEDIKIKDIYKALIPYFIGILLLFILIFIVYYLINIPVGVGANTII